MALSAHTNNNKYTDGAIENTPGLHTSGDPEAGSLSHSETFNNYKHHVKAQ